MHARSFIIFSMLPAMMSFSALGQEASDRGPRDDATLDKRLVQPSPSSEADMVVRPNEDNDAAMETYEVWRRVILARKDLGIPKDALVPDTLSGEQDCDQVAEAPSACVWSSAADAIVFAEVSALRLSTENAVIAEEKGGWRAYPNCRHANPALAIDLEVKSVLAGTAPEALTLWVGAEQTAQFKPVPLRSEGGDVVWASSKDSSTGPLLAGSRIVTAIHRVAGTWSLKGDVILGVDAGNIVYLPRRTGDCLNTRPKGIDRITVDQLSDMLANCGDEDSEKVLSTRALRESLWGERQRPSYYAAPYCTDPTSDFDRSAVDLVASDQQLADSPDVTHSEE